MRVIAAMSGGVDSSVAAARMVDAGHEVVGVHLALSRSSASSGSGSRGCCTLDDARAARRVADQLGIPFYVWDLSERFRDEVIADFVDEYRSGRTPNPCLRCNEKIKFSAVLDRALAMDFDAVATGHYARIVDGPAGPELHRAADPAKDQSYVLGVLTAAQLAHSAFPLCYDVKDVVRDEAERRGLQVARKPDSHDICFIPDGDTAAFVRSRVGSVPGDVVDATTGEVVARHDGAHAFTIGQRRGLNLRVPAADGAPRYVVDVDVVTSVVRVGPPELLDVDGIEGIRVVWAGPAVGADPVRVHAQVRAHGLPVAARARMSGDRLVVDLDESVRGLAAGQAVVLYDGTRVIGSATVDTTRRVTHAGSG
jgi:tRNA-specific 2-thiouridylase